MKLFKKTTVAAALQAKEEATPADVHVLWASRVAACTLRKGSGTVTVKDDKPSSTVEGRKVVVGIFVSGVFVVTSENKELLETLNYDVTAAGEVLFEDNNSDCMSAVPFNRIMHLEQDGDKISYSYLAHTTFVHISPSAIVNRGLLSLPHTPLQKSIVDEYMHAATITCTSAEAAAELMGHLRAAKQRFDDGMCWLRLGFPLKTEVVPLALTCEGRVIDSAPEFCKPYQLPAEWDEWLRSGADRCVDVHMYSPLGPVVVHLTTAKFPELVDDESSTQGALFKLVGWPVPPKPGALKMQVSKVAHNAGALPSGSEDMDKHDKCVLLHCKATQRPAVQGTQQPAAAPAADAAAGPRSMLAAAVCVVVVQLLSWLLTGCERGAGRAMLKASVLLAAALAGGWYVLGASTKRQRQAAAAAAAAGAPPAASQWTLELMLAQVTQYTSIAASENWSFSSSRPPPEQGMATLLETRPTTLASTLSPEFQELAARSPWVTDDIITRYIKGMGSEAAGYACLRTTVEWREKDNADTILQRPVKVYGRLKRLAPHSMLCPANDGAPVLVMCGGGWLAHFDEILSNDTTDHDFEEYLCWMLEFMLKYDPRPWPKGVFHVFLDIAGLRMSDMTGARWRVVNTCLQMFEKHYKERLGSAVIINAPGWWGFVWRLVTPLLPKAILDKVQVTTNLKHAREAMAKLVPEDRIPKEYGGDCPWDLGKSPWDEEQRAVLEPLNKAAGFL